MKDSDREAAPDDEMELHPHERLIADALVEYQERRLSGAPLAVSEYAFRLGRDAYAEFCELLAVEAAIDDALGDRPAPARRRSHWVRKAVAIAAGILVCVLAWQWIQGDATAPVSPVDEGSSTDLARLEREILGHDSPQTLVPLSTLRSAGSDLEHGLLPAGALRPADLRSLVLVLPEMAPIEGRLVFRRTDGTVLYEEALERDAIVLHRAVPEAVRAALGSGGEATWGFETDDGSRWTVPIRVLEPEAVRAVDAALERVRAGTISASGSVRAWLEASLLLERGLHTAALRAAEAATEEPGEGTSPLPWLQAREALHRLGQFESPLSDPVAEALEAFSRAELAAFVESRAPRR